MRHRIYGKHLGRDKNQRNALFKGLVRSLFLHENITTTEAKAKAIKGLVDKLIVGGKKGSSQAKQFVRSVLPETAVSQKLVREIALRYQGRMSGFTRLVKLGRRLGDGAMMVRMSLIEGNKQLPVTSSQLSEKVKPDAVKLKTAKPKSKNPARKTDNKKPRKGSK